MKITLHFLVALAALTLLTMPGTASAAVGKAGSSAARQSAPVELTWDLSRMLRAARSH